MITVEIVGVGGQGVLSASRILGEACLAQGHKVTTSEIHGMAQRGGVVRSTLRIGSADAPLGPSGSSDLLVAFEPAEGLRAIALLKPEGRIVCESVPRPPPAVAQGKAAYPDMDALRAALEARGATRYLDATALAREAGNPRTASVVMVGAAWAHGALPLDREALETAIRLTVPPKTVDVNLKALELGRQAMAAP